MNVRGGGLRDLSKLAELSWSYGECEGGGASPFTSGTISIAGVETGIGIPTLDQILLDLSTSASIVPKPE